MSAFAIVLASTACAGNSGENKKSNEPTKEENKMEVVSLNKADFLKKVYNYEANPKEWKFEGSRPAIVDFYATWCGPCKALHPVLEELSKEYSGKVDIYQIDVDKAVSYTHLLLPKPWNCAGKSLHILPMNGLLPEYGHRRSHSVR